MKERKKEREREKHRQMVSKGKERDNNFYSCVTTLLKFFFLLFICPSNGVEDEFPLLQPLFMLIC
jgi:hypothetical protein